MTSVSFERCSNRKSSFCCAALEIQQNARLEPTPGKVVTASFVVKKDALLREKLDINGAILEVISLIHSEVIKNVVTVGTELAETLPRIQGDRVQLQQVILNLLINAIQAMRDLAEGQRELHVSTALIETEGVRVAVRDTGPGLRPQDLERLFVPFYTTKPNGMGMGL
jgi:C4-dicarboxylate-specific signal transduction histidine kinase